MQQMKEVSDHMLQTFNTAVDDFDALDTAPDGAAK
jgi:hypothetical protein